MASKKQINYGERIANGLFWTYGERITAQGISLIVSIILARLLSPAEYGIISIVMIFITLCNTFVTGGFGNSLIQKRDSDDLDFSTIFYCSLFLSIFLYIALFFSAPFIGRFYNNALLVPVIRILGLRIPISGINSIQQARIAKKMAFKRFFFATLTGTLISAIVGITMAYKGMGVWALVAQYLTNSTIDTIVLFATEKWFPKWMFSWQRAKTLLAFGWKVLFTNLVYTLEGDIRSLIIGKVFGASDLAFYDQGKKYPNVIVANINTSISKVMFPAFSQNQDDLSSMKRMNRRAVQIDAFLLSPLLVGLIATADTFVSCLLTEKWLPCVPYLRILSIVFLVKPLATICQQSILAVGKSGITLKIEVVQNILAIVLLCISVFGFSSVPMIAWSNVITEIVGLAMFMFYVNKLIGYTIREQLLDLIPSLGSSIIMGISVWSMHFVDLSFVLLLLLQVLTGVVIYCLISCIIKNKALIYLLSLLSNKTKSVALEKILKVVDR